VGDAACVSFARTRAVPSARAWFERANGSSLGDPSVLLPAAFYCTRALYCMPAEAAVSSAPFAPHARPPRMLSRDRPSSPLDFDGEIRFDESSLANESEIEAGRETT